MALQYYVGYGPFAVTPWRERLFPPNRPAKRRHLMRKLPIGPGGSRNMLVGPFPD